MHDRSHNDRSAILVPSLQAEIGAFRRVRAKASNGLLALIGDYSLLLLLLIATAGAIIAIQSPLGHGKYALPLVGQTETLTRTFTESFSGALVRDKAWFDQQRARVAYFQEQHMSFSQLMNRWQPLVSQASKKFGVPAAWIRVVMQMESGGRTMLNEKQHITSPVGAVGLMQLMPGTYDEMRQQYKLGANRFDPRDNIMAGAAYLSWLHRRYGFPAMFVAYNDGPGNLEAKRDHGRALPAETRNYVAKICAVLGTSVPGTSKAKASLAKFTRPNGKPVWIDKSSVASVRAPLRGEYPRSVKAVITVGKVKQAVRETVTAARSSLRVHTRYG
ncbi:MAG TPA: lytic transglycosylase domain-containing protein [Rhizomicrobium sp.]|nr:lytic transglycosylase domain-containing protein [Rhizomicrobium sp.]